MRLLTIAAAAVALAGLSSPAFAADPPISNPNQIVESVTAESVSQLVTELGGQQVKIVDAGTSKIVTFQDGGTPYNFTPTGCDQNICTGLSLLVVVDNSTAALPAETLVNASKENPLLSFFKVDSGKFAVGRITLVRGGVTNKHLAFEMSLFVVAYREAMQKLSTQLITSVNRPGPFQRASYGNGALRAVPVPAALVAKLVPNLPRDGQPGLRGFRR
jgi:hypothetical protein